MTELTELTELTEMNTEERLDACLNVGDNVLRVIANLEVQWDETRKFEDRLRELLDALREQYKQEKKNKGEIDFSGELALAGKTTKEIIDRQQAIRDEYKAFMDNLSTLYGTFYTKYA